MITSNVTWGLFHEIHQLKRKEMCAPRMAVLLPTYKCNQNCYYCFYKHLNNGHTMSYDQIIDVILV